MKKNDNPKLSHLRQLMKKQQIDALLIRSTDQFLSEYVPPELSRRVYITGFTGSVGDALITAKDVFLFVDGRYTLQAAKECPSFKIVVASMGESIESNMLKYLNKLKDMDLKSLAVESDRIPVLLFNKIKSICQESNIEVLTPEISLVDSTREALGPKTALTPSKIWPISEKLSGQNPLSRLKKIVDFYAKNQISIIASVLLDEIAWLTNLRGNQFPYQATFAAKALVFKEEIWLFLADEHRQLLDSQPGIKYFSAEKWSTTLKKHFSEKKLPVGINPHTTPKAIEQDFIDAGAKVAYIDNPFAALKALKTKAELKHMRFAFSQADKVVHKTQKWVAKNIVLNQPVSEADVDTKVRKEFIKSGAIGLSFKPICAAGKNGAFIHYGTPSKKNFLKKGQMFLLDTGGFYQGGYATDLTRTFLIGEKKTKASKLHKAMFTSVLKGAIAGMNARFPKNTTGIQLDAIVRNAIWQTGLNFQHGTGHGVGINVHESPPGISPKSNFCLLEGHIFSIEPGIYLEGIGGVRIENLCTVVQDPHNTTFLNVLPLTFAPLDNRLIEKSMLTLVEKTFLKYYTKCFKVSPNQLPPLPPHDQSILTCLPKRKLT